MQSEFVFLHLFIFDARQCVEDTGQPFSPSNPVYIFSIVNIVMITKYNTRYETARYETSVYVLLNG